MSEINTFVHQARDKGLSDEAIRKALEAEGWAMPLIDTALLDIEVPKPSSEATPSSQLSHTSLSPLMAAMQHVLLWFFVASSTVTIASVVASLSGYSVSERVLASMIAVTLITFTPYAVLFLVYTLRLRKTPDLIPGKVWSIITICLHSVAAMAAGITLVVTLIVSGEFSVWLSALLILILDLIVLVTYVFAAFAGKKLQMVRKITVTAHLPILLVLFGTLFIMSLLQLGPAKHDEQLRKDLVSTAVAVREYATQHNTLPASNDTSVVKGSDIHYTKKTESTYELCADFQANAQRTNSYSYYYRDNQMTLSDDYPSEYQFEGYGSGEHCFTLQSSPLEDKRNPSYY